MIVSPPTPPVVIVCPQCLKPVQLASGVVVTPSGELVVDHRHAKRGMLIHVTKGCVHR